MTAALAGCLIAHAASAQKNPGQLLPVAPQPIPAPVYRAPQPPPPAPRAGSPDPQVEAMVQTLPLDPATRELTDREPADIRGVEARLNLREARGVRTDLRDHRPSSREIVDALASR